MKFELDQLLSEMDELNIDREWEQMKPVGKEILSPFDPNYKPHIDQAEIARNNRTSQASTLCRERQLNDPDPMKRAMAKNPLAWVDSKAAPAPVESRVSRKYE